jgi:23S rRNA pseudouridine1911/1915/1917 synthase
MSDETPAEATAPAEPPAAATHSCLAPAAAAGERLDRFLAEAVGALSRSRVKALIEAGCAACDGTVVRQPAAPVRAGSRYTLYVPAPLPAAPAPQAIPLPILYEDRDLLVLDKPAGLVVHPAPGNEEGTLVNALLAHCGADLPGIGGERRPGIVHRLDKDTSGVMVVAKTEAALAALSAAFAARDLERTYLALCWGLPSPASGEISGAIGRDPRERKRMAVLDRGGKPALTRYRTLACHGTAVALLECRLATGRTHQIRVHLAHRGHPLVGDPTYLRRIPAAARTLPEPLARLLLDFPRQALHAASLGFRHPATGAWLHFTTPPPADLRHLLEALEMAGV